MIDRGAQSGAGWTRYLLPPCLMLAGFCGISYEILYARLLGNLLGSQFTINASVLLTFLLGIGVGTLYAHRFSRWLWAIEAGIGAYAAAMALAYRAIDSFLYSAVPFLGTSTLATAVAAIVLLLAPALLIGCSVPLFAHYFVHLRTTRVFSLTYGIYNIGAALTALMMEFTLLRMFGLRSTTILLACLNGLVALGVLVSTHSMPRVVPRPTERIRFAKRVLAALALASVASAIFQLLMIKLAECVFGPYNETFALVLANVLFGISIGSFAAGRFGWTFRQAVGIAIAGVAGLLALFPLAVRLWAIAYLPAAESYTLFVLLKFGFVFVIMGLPAIGFGATIPALLQEHRHVARESGQLLFVSSMGNVLGFVLMAFVLHRALDYGPILVTVALLAAVAILLERRPTGRAVMAVSGWAAVALVAFVVSWDESLLYIGHSNLRRPADLERLHRSVTFEERFKGAQDVFAIQRRNGQPFFFINGYISIPLSNPEEKIVGSISSMYSPRTDRALVLGLGSGATAGTVGTLFDRTDVVEINKVVIDHQHLMSEYSFDITDQPGVEIFHDDGVHFIKVSPERYSLILNTVTSPLYFSSSKLYTLDFFEMVKRRLTPDGVYVTWIDYRLGDRGFDTILASLEQAFDSCSFSYLTEAYFLLVCSNEPLALHGYDHVVSNEPLRKFFAEEYRLPVAMFPYIVLAPDAFRLRSANTAALNTLDYPALEFEMARLRRQAIPEFGARLGQVLDPDELRGAVGPELAWDPWEFAFFAERRLPSKEPLTRMILDSVDGSAGSFDDVALRVAEEVGGADAYFRFGRFLLRYKRYDAAIRLLSRALEMDPSRDNVNFHLARAYGGAGEFDLAFEHSLAEWELDRDNEVPLLAARALIEGGRYGDALGWLDAAELLKYRSDPVDVYYYRAAAYEGLGDPGRARDHYLNALRFDKNHAAARDAVERLERERK